MSSLHDHLSLFFRLHLIVFFSGNIWLFKFETLVTRGTLLFGISTYSSTALAIHESRGRISTCRHICRHHCSAAKSRIWLSCKSPHGSDDFCEPRGESALWRQSALWRRSGLMLFRMRNETTRERKPEPPRLTWIC